MLNIHIYIERIYNPATNEWLENIILVGKPFAVRVLDLYLGACGLGVELSANWVFEDAFKGVTYVGAFFQPAEQ